MAVSSERRVGWIRWEDGSPELRLEHPLCEAEHDCGERAVFVVAMMAPELAEWGIAPGGETIYGACMTVVETMATDLGISVDEGLLWSR